MFVHRSNSHHHITTFAPFPRFAICVFAVTILACGRSDLGVDDSLGETWGDSSDDGAETGGMMTDLSHGETFCVDIVSGQTTCWIGWGDWYAQVFLPCQVKASVGIVWGVGMDTVIDGWDLVVCHELLTGGSICLLGSDVALFYDQLEHPGVWWPNESAIVGDYVHVESPCVENYPPGEAWGPCPIDLATGVHTLCNSTTLACVPTKGVTAAMCLPYGCPAELPDFSGVFEEGTGGVCYPRCIVDEDCAVGMICNQAQIDGMPMCSWTL